ncbi:MAG: winged helix-turn-helix transcriptional regulator [Elusimicrobia bacterium]|nr:winged helix-turn-helix transcriptional regulator [Elusimicrobiota bacterium]
MNEELNKENAYKVLDLISQSSRLSQRELASSTGLSLGLVNLIIKRLTKTGYIKVSSLNNRKSEYLVTTKGLMNKAQRTSSYISVTVKTFMEFRRRISQLLGDFMKEGHRRFVIVGQGEIASLVEMMLKEMGAGVKYRSLKPGEEPQADETILDCRLEGYEGNVGVSVLARLLGVNGISGETL